MRRSFFIPVLVLQMSIVNFTPVLADETSSPDAAATASAAATEPTAPATLESRILEIVNNYGLTAEDLAYYYYEPETQQSYGWNETGNLFAASTYKLPLNMWYYEQEAAGNIDPEANVGGYVLSEAHYLSIVQSNNEASQAMVYGMDGTYSTFINNIFTSYGGEKYADLSNVPSIEYSENYLPCDFLMSTLQYLYANQANFQELLSYMSDPNQRNMVAQTIPSTVTVYQKQGWIDYCNNICEMVATERPYLMVVMVNNRTDSNEIASTVNTTTYEYNADMINYENEVAAYEAELAAEEQAAAEAEASASAAAVLAASEAESESSSHLLRTISIIAAAAVVILVLLMMAEKKRKHHHTAG